MTMKVIDLIISRDRAQSSIADMRELAERPEYKALADGAIGCMEAILGLINDELVVLDSASHIEHHVVSLIEMEREPYDRDGYGEGSDGA